MRVPLMICQYQIKLFHILYSLGSFGNLFGVMHRFPSPYQQQQRYQHQYKPRNYHGAGGPPRFQHYQQPPMGAAKYPEYPQYPQHRPVQHRPLYHAPKQQHTSVVLAPPRSSPPPLLYRPVLDYIECDALLDYEPEPILCEHKAHRLLSTEMTVAMYNNNPKTYWTELFHWMNSEPLQFTYGNACFTDMIADLKLYQHGLPKMTEIISVGSGLGATDYFIGRVLLRAKVVRLTDIRPLHPCVQELSCHAAVSKYSGADTLMLAYPYFMDKGYTDIISHFAYQGGTYVVFLGDDEEQGRNPPLNDPANVLEQLEQFCTVRFMTHMNTCKHVKKRETFTVYEMRLQYQ